MELLPGAAEGGQPGHMPAQGVQGAGVGACGGHRAQSLTAQDTSPSPGCSRTPGTWRCPSPTLTCLHRGFHHTPGGISPLACDNILLEGLQPVLHQGVEGRAEGVQQQVPHVRVEPAVPQLGLREAKQEEREEKGSTRP